MSEEEDDTNYDKDDISMIDSMFKSTGSGQTMSFKVFFYKFYPYFIKKIGSKKAVAW